MKRLSGNKRYTAIYNESTGDSNGLLQRSWQWNAQQSSHETPPPEYELNQREVSSRSFEPVPPGWHPQANQNRYSALASSVSLKDTSLTASIGAGKVDTGFNPLFTRRWVLLCFAIFWALIVLSLQIIYSVSTAKQGLATTNASLRYIWTYGPTAFLIVCTIMWRQVDYAAKYVQPWAVLAKGPLPAEQTLLLDYMTRLQIVAFWKALKFRHITVASTILIFVLIKVLTVISTGLFALQPTPFEGKSQNMKATTVFDPDATVPLEAVDSRAAMALYGHEAYKMLLPNGTTEQFAFQLFEPTDRNLEGVYTYNASVDVFTADGWDCESGVLAYENGFDHDSTDDFGNENTPVASYYNTTIKLPDCNIYNGHLDAPSWYWPENTTDPLYGYWAAFQRVNCSNLDPADNVFQRYTVSVAYSKGIGQNNNTMLNSSNVVCRPSYSIQPGYVTMSGNGDLVDVVLSGTPRQLKGVAANNLAQAVWTTIKLTSIPAQFNAYNITTDAFVRDMIRVTPNFKSEMLLNNTWLMNASQRVFERTAAQIAGLYLLKPNEQSSLFEGTITNMEQRLIVRSLPTRLMQACAATMLVLTIIMIFTIPQKVVPRPVESVASIAVILASSPSLVALLRNTGHLRASRLRQALSGFTFMSAVADAPHGKTFSIRAIANSATSFSPNSNKRIRWTRPLVLRRFVMTLTLSLAVGVLIALEILYRQALGHNGLADVEVDSVQRYIWTYTPTVVLILLATTFNVLDFELEFTDPYHELVRGHANAGSSLLWDPLRNISPQTCFHAFRHSRFALVASTISVIVAPMLTIVVSGLFVAQSIPHTSTIDPRSVSWFNLSSSPDFVTESQAMSFAIPALILQGNMSYPQWTFDEFAFPAVDLSAQSTGLVNSSSGTLLINSPAVRGAVNCSLIPKSQFNNLTYGLDCGDGCIEFNITTLDGCGNSGWIGSDFIWRTGSTKVPPSGTGYFGDVHVGPGEITRESDNKTVACPNYIATYGRVEKQEIKDYNAFFCTTGFETVQTKATIDMTLQTITSISEVYEDSANIFNKYWSPESNAPYFIPINLTNTDEVLDYFTTAMIYGKTGVPTAELFSSPDTYVKQFTRTYRQWTAQWANVHLRENTTTLAQNTSNIAGSNLPTSLPGTYTDPNRQRLFLSEISTRILQGIIAILIVCGVVIFFLVDMSHVLPKSMGSIAAVASLLAGSRFVDEKSGMIPRGTEWLSDSKIAKSGMWSDHKFRMGWWDDRDDGNGLREGGGYDHVRDRDNSAGEVDDGRDGSNEKDQFFRIDVISRGRQ